MILMVESIDVFVHKMDASGNFIWAKSFGSTYYDLGSSITLDAFGNIYTTGEFWGTVDFNFGTGISNLSAIGFQDIFVHKICPCIPTTGIDVQTACDSYTWIDGNTYTAANNTATDTLTYMAGCDSVVTLNLTINNSNTGLD